ncbi:hypothetical protein C1633_26595, partial [Pseudomonas protegens]
FERGFHLSALFPPTLKKAFKKTPPGCPRPAPNPWVGGLGGRRWCPRPPRKGCARRWGCAFWRSRLAGEEGRKACAALECAFACRSRLAGEEGRKACAALECAFVCRSRLAGEEGRKACVELEGAFAGKPAPTDSR